MLRHRLVRQSALNISSGSEGSNMPSPQPIRRRRNSQSNDLYKQLSSESAEDLIHSSEYRDKPKRSDRRHSVACGILYVDIQKPNLKSAFNSAVRRVTGACSLLSSAPSSTYNLSPQQSIELPKKKEAEVLLPYVLGTFRQNQHLLDKNSKNNGKIHFQVNRRFSTDCPPPSYSDAVNVWKQPTSKQKYLAKQNEMVSSKGSLVAAVEDDDLNLVE